MLSPALRPLWTALTLACTVVLSGFSSLDAQTAPDPVALAREFSALVKKHCAKCHGNRQPRGELNLLKVQRDLESPEAFAREREVWEAILEVLHAGEMPPDDQPPLPSKQREQIVNRLSRALASIPCDEDPRPGRVTLRRLNRTEYTNTIRDLTGLKIEPAADFPADNVGDGFDNIADVLTMPPILVEKYLNAAEQITDAVFADDAARRRIVFCTPSDGQAPRTCAEKILTRFARLAFRRPPRAEQVQRLLKLFDGAYGDAKRFEPAIQLALQGVLISPHFLFRVERDGEDGPRPLDDYEIASRLSYFLWSSMPDERLFELAAAGRLRDDSVLQKEVGRMLRDPRVEQFVENFGGQWLQLRELTAVSPDRGSYPEFDDALRNAMVGETREFLAAIVREDRNVLEIIDADYTFLNERLAKHYGIAGVSGGEFRRVALTDRRRGGILGQASILTLTSHPTRTSPVKRGKWVLQNVLGTPPPPPPPEVEMLAEDADAQLLGSLRERMEQHRSDATCAVCHNRMDPLGFALENFDAIGGWRDLDGKFKIDPAGQLPGGVAFSGPAELKSVLRDKKGRDFVRCLTEKLLTYAIGRGLRAFDRCAVDDIIGRAEKRDLRFSSLVIGVVTSDPFRLRDSAEGSE